MAVDPERRSAEFEAYATGYSAATGGEPVFVQVHERAPDRRPPRPFEWLCAEDGPHVRLYGEPVGTVLRHAEFVGAGVLLLSRRGGWRGWWGRSMSAEVLRRSRMPVQLVRERGLPRRGGRVEHVLCAVALDGGDASTVELAVSVAARSGARVTLLHVLPEISEGLLAWGTADHDLPLGETAALARLSAMGGTAPVPVDVRTGRGNVTAVVAREAGRQGSDLIVMGGSRFAGAQVRRLSPWSLLRRVDCAVLVAPAG